MLFSICLLLSFSFLVSSISPTSAPDLAAARRNAFRIFNTVHSAMRQFGSSSNHNGLSFFLATVPEGNLFYHGRHSPSRPDSFDWLAFEVEHGYGFAQPRMPMPPPPGRPPPDILSWHLPNSGISETKHGSHFKEDSNDQHRLVEPGDDDNREKPESPPVSRGYFQTYRAERPLKLIYIDGMGAAKGSWGTLDSQDLLLEGVDRNFTDGPNFGDVVYGHFLCKLGKEWGIDGWIRMECGFEIIYCDFAPGGGLELVSSHGTAFANETLYRQESDTSLLFEIMRAAAKRYHGMSRGRIEVDWSSMVSAFAYDVNITNPDLERQDLPRLLEVKKEEKETVRARLGEVVAGRKDGVKSTINWQSVVDDIISRFSDKFHYIVHGNLSAEILWGEVSTLIHPFLDFPKDMNASTPSPESVTRCTRHYLSAAMIRRDTWTPEDTAIFVAIEVVSEKICSSLFQIRSLLHSSTRSEKIESSLTRSREVATTLMERLQWTTWKECGPCAREGHFCFIPMFPAGNLEDYYAPSCKGIEDMEEAFKGCYWSLGVPNLFPGFPGDCKVVGK
jgi:hypothetical protein